jgi:hypothetical protein
VAGRFPLYTDADLHGPLVGALIERGWDVVRAVEARPEAEDDLVHFKLAAEQNRVLVANDRHQRQIALAWIEARRPFRGFLTWKQKHHEHMSVGEFLEAFEALAAEDDPFAYKIRYITPKH